nr:Chain E, peptide2GRM_D Chain D, peptide [synthetic construct]2GRM_E Chain E, peptide [synthetic construct]
AITLIFI